MPTSEELLQQGDATFKQRQYAEATELFQQATELAQTEGKSQVLVEALAMTARGYLIRELKNEGRPWLNRAKEIARPDEPRGWSRYLGVLGRFQWQDDIKPTAAETFREMYDYCLQHELHDRAIDAAHMVAITGTPAQQIEWGKKGIEAAEAGGITGWLGPLWNNLGATYDDAADYESALEAYQKAREYHWQFGDEQNRLVADWAVGKTFRRLGQHETALAWLRPVLAWAERRYAEESSVDRGEWLGLACWDLGAIAAAQGDRDTALDLLTRAHKHLEAANMDDWDAKSWQEINDLIDELNRSN
jgi:tetratricopeptide (TPR) repeat protein